MTWGAVLWLHSNDNDNNRDNDNNNNNNNKNDNDNSTKYNDNDDDCSINYKYDNNDNDNDHNDNAAGGQLAVALQGKAEPVPLEPTRRTVAGAGMSGPSQPRRSVQYMIHGNCMIYHR